MSFADDLWGFTMKLDATTQAVFVNTVSHVHESIADGSPVTGSPGQPVGEGILKASWQETFESPTSALVSTNVPWALPNEEGVREDGRPYVQRSPVGGRHSVKLTRVGFQQIVEVETAKVVGGGGT